MMTIVVLILIIILLLLLVGLLLVLLTLRNKARPEEPEDAAQIPDPDQGRHAQQGALLLVLL